jgi:hypothetical protein
VDTQGDLMLLWLPPSLITFNRDVGYGTKRTDLPVWRGPLIGVDRKWLVEAQNDANDLHEALVVRRNELFRGAIQPSSRLTRFVINCAFS